MSRHPVKSALQQATNQDLLRAVGIVGHPLGEYVLRWPLSWLTRGLVHQAAEFEACVRERGLYTAAHRYLSSLGAILDVKGSGEIPSNGPILLVSNHPGLTDTLALFSTIQRKDLVIVANSNPFLEALESVRKQLILLPEGQSQKGLSLRRALHHLKQNGSLLTFPSGQIEPDPALHPEAAVASLADWSESLALLTRATPNVRVLPLLVSGVLHPRAQRHWLTRIRRDRNGREQVAVYLQLLRKRFQQVVVQVRIGELIEPSDFVLAEVRSEMTRLIRESTGKRSEQIEIMNVEQKVSVSELTASELQPPA